MGRPFLWAPRLCRSGSREPNPAVSALRVLILGAGFVAAHAAALPLCRGRRVRMSIWVALQFVLARAVARLLVQCKSEEGGMTKKINVGLDVHKVSVAVAVAEDARGGEVRFIGDIPNTPEAVSKLVKKLSKQHAELDFCYEAGGCGYGIYRQITESGYLCSVVAPSRIPTAPGDRVKTDRRDAQRLAVLHRSGDLTAVWVPDQMHEAMRDLVRARLDSTMHLMRAREQLLAFLLQSRKNLRIQPEALASSP